MDAGARRVTERVGTAAGIGTLLFVGVLSGGDVWTVTVTIGSLFVRAVFPEGIVSVLLFTGVVTLAGGLVVRDVWGRTAAEPVRSGPPVRAIVPAYRDAEVVDVSVERLLESDYEPLSIAVVVEPGDPATRERARELAASHDAVDCLINADPGSKATAINTAVERADADYFAVFDADERPEPGFVPAAVGGLRDGADVFQGRRIPRPTGGVETLAYCERLIVQAGFACSELFGFTHCQSSATAFTRAAFEAVDGYDDRLTEDIDFAHSCYRAGLSVVRDGRHASTMEAPHGLRDLWCQRKRWRVGHVEVFDARLREALSGPPAVADVVPVGRAVGTLLGGAFLLVLTAQALLLLVSGLFWAFFVPFGLVLATIAAVTVRDVADGRIPHPSVTLLLFPLVYVGHGALTVKALLEYYLTWDGEWYQVTKTGA